MAGNQNLGSGNTPSATATGQAGALFEQHVDALFLAHLLIRGIPPVLKDSVVKEVHLQTRHAGWHTDDIVLYCESGMGETSKLAMQVKRSITISSSNEECVATFTGFWKDFHNQTRFDKNLDRLAIVVLHGTQTLMKNLIPLLDCARACRDSTDFESRLSQQGYLSLTAHEQNTAIQEICRKASGGTLVPELYLEFLRSIHVVAYDLATASAQSEAMLINLLAATAVGHDKHTVAAHTWTELVKTAGESMAVAKSWRWDDLPHGIRAKHGVLSGKQHQAMAALSAHGRTILDKIQTTILGKVTVHRDKIQSRIYHCLADNRVVLISGPAGAGKSAVARSIIDTLSRDHFVFAFRAEEFAESHLDATLQKAQVDLPETELRGLLAGQGRKVLLIDSVERLLEHSTRDAFTDLLSLASKDEGLQLLLTCRSYSLEIVRSYLVAMLKVPFSEVEVSEFSDEELTAIAEEITELKRPLSSSVLRKILKNAYLLDKAAQMPWPDGATLPENERAFRQRFWSEIVRDDSTQIAGMPARREETFEQLALRRARFLTPYARCDDLDQSSLTELRKANLIVSPEATLNLAATSHDVLEDWALIKWMHEQFLLSQGDYAKFLAAIESCPAIRRAYRKWLQELLACEAALADPLIEHVLTSPEALSHFRDDTCIAVLLSDLAGQFLERNETLLIAEQCQLLIRMIHLLRTACVTTPPWLKPPAVLLVPHGSAWEAMLKVVTKHLARLLPSSRLLILGLVSDWSKNVSWWNSYPPGSEEAAFIAYRLLPLFDAYDLEKEHRATLDVIVKIPRVAEQQYLELIELIKDPREDFATAEYLEEILLEGAQSLPTARDYPDQLISLAEFKFPITYQELLTDDSYGEALFAEKAFGVSNKLNFDFFPASAYRGIFAPLLRFHTERALDYLVRLFNHVADCYIDPRFNRRLESAEVVTLTHSDGSQTNQWWNDRFWRLYRGTSVGPYVLQSALMALERFLMESCQDAPESIEPILIKLLRESKNASLSAVVASIAIAYPSLAGDAALTLLTCREFIVNDKIRQITDPQAQALTDGLPTRPEYEIFNSERKAANSWTHRQSDLEIMALNLQRGPQTERVQEIIDHHKAQLPAITEQTNEDQQWRLALHRMDLRCYSAQLVEADARQIDDHPSSGVVRLESKNIDSDLQEMIDREAPSIRDFNEDMSLFNWASQTFARRLPADTGTNNWKERLAEANAYHAQLLNGKRTSPLADNAPGFTAAVCARDHWDEMDAAEQQWCLGVLVDSIEKDCDVAGDQQLISKNPAEASRPAAYCMAVLLTKEVTPVQEKQLLHGLSKSLTHSCKEVIACAAEGVGRHLWKENLELARLATFAMVRRSIAIDKRLSANRSLEWSNREDYYAIVQSVNVPIRNTIAHKQSIPESELEALDFCGDQTRFDTDILLSLIRDCPEDLTAALLFQKAVLAVVASWKSPRRRGQDDERLPPEQLSAILSRFAHYSLTISPAKAASLCAPLLNAVDEKYREVANFVRDLAAAEDEMRTGENFWLLWQLFADRVGKASWLADLSSDYPGYGELLNAIFLGLPWSRELKHWEPLTGQQQRLDALALSLPNHHRVLDEYVMYLYFIGEHSLPKSFITLATLLERGNGSLLSQSQTIFHLGRVLQVFVYGKPIQLKSSPAIQAAVLKILDALVEAGSSVAYRMRDDFVTPLTGN